MVPESRLSILNDGPMDRSADYVLYWMVMNRRPTFNFALQRAAALADELGKPLIILEALRCGYRWASDRIHGFILDGMASNMASFANAPVTYYPYVEPREGDGRGLVQALSERACVVITDTFPCFMLPRMTAAAAAQVSVRMEAVDSNGLIPLTAPDKTFTRAYSLRRWIHKNIRPHLGAFPLPDPLRGMELPALTAVPESIQARWPRAAPQRLAGEGLELLPIDHSVCVVPGVRGGHDAALQVWRQFLHGDLKRYISDRNNPTEDVTSGLSPYLHFGHISAHRIFTELADNEGWDPDDLAPEVTGKREGWWGMSAVAEAFLDELITWRELGYNLCHREDDYDRYDSLPQWARATLAEHAADPREAVYTLDEFERGQTHDPLWNAAQRQLRSEGRIHNYLRMLWGKKILQWSASPQEALSIMIELNNKYALDGRNPNSYSGIFWVLGRYDRAWGPERPVFGKIRYMTSESTARKTNVKGYLHRFGDQQSLF